MNAFETELGVFNEISQSINDLGWLLPTDIQSDAIPLILGGGDVLMAAETGSGKTGAFCIPVIQIVYETLKEFQKSSSGGTASSNNPSPSKLQMNVYDRTSALAIDTEGLLCQSRDQAAWHGCRSNRGVFSKGKFYYEATVTDEGLCRVGWSTQDSALDLGTDKYGFGFGGTGKKSNSKDFTNYGESYGINDTVGCYLDLDTMTIKWSKNGHVFENAYSIPKNLQQSSFYAAVCMKNAEIKFNFGSTPFKYPPTEPGYIALSQAGPEQSVNSTIGASVVAVKRQSNAPLAIIIEPSKELAEQTLKQIQLFKKNLKNPDIKELLLAGGLAVKEQIAKIQDGVDIVVATPGRLDDLVSTERLNLNQVQFFVLDEVDGLLSQGHKDLIMKIHKRIPTIKNGRRLQMIVCSATLHNFDVKKLADQVMHFPTWIDLKGQDSVPDTIHHCVCIIDPKVDLSWRNLKKQIHTDEVHARDRIDLANLDSKETLSEAVKVLKAEYCLHAIRKFNMDKALIFCRTKLDCDNLENYFTSLGGGPNSTGHQFSCVCLHADRTPKERSDNLEMFKQNKVRFMICTDVAARGLDITGLPYVINLTLPDDKQNYIHRIGRVGRADRMGLAISFVSKHKEKVWYHTCASRGKGCFNTTLKEDGGCCVWYNEMQYLDDIEDHLGITISQVPSTLEIPVDDFDGKVVYGEKRAKKTNSYVGHVEVLAPTVKELVKLEKKSQLNYLNMKYNKNLLA